MRSRRQGGDRDPRHLPRTLAALGLAAAAIVLSCVFLDHEASVDRDGRPTLGALTAPVDLAVAAGAALAEPGKRLAPIARSPAVLFLALGTGLLLALGGRRRAAPATPPPPPRPFDPASLLLLVPLAVGFVARFHRLSDVPAGYSGHALVHHHQLSLPILRDVVLPLASGHLAAAAQIPALLVENHFGLMSLLSALGFAVTGTGFVASRLPSALAGTVTLLVAYRLGRDLEDRAAGIAMAALLAAAPWHLSISRYGDLEHVLSPLHALVVLSAYVAALRRGGLLDHVVAGVALGVSVYVYPANLTLPLVVLPHLAITTAIRRDRRAAGKALLLATISVALAWGAIHEQLKGGLLTPSIRTGYTDSGPLPLTNLARYAAGFRMGLRQMFVDAMDPWFERHGGGLGAALAILALLGGGVVLGDLADRTRRGRSLLLLAAFPVCMLPGVLAPDPSFRRFFPAATVAVAVAAIGVSRVSSGLGAIGVSRLARALGLAALLAPLALADLHSYTSELYVDAEEGGAAEPVIASFARATLGRTYVAIVCPDEIGPREMRDWLELGAGARLAELRGPVDRWVSVLPAKELGRFLTGRPAIDGKTTFLSWWSFTHDEPAGMRAREEIRTAFPGVRESALCDCRGRTVARVLHVGP